MAMASFSEGSGFSLAFAWGLQQRQMAAVRVDSQSTAWRQCAQAAKSWPDVSLRTRSVPVVGG
jgi:hypothetical protein